MSMNLHLSGEREVTVNKTGKTSKQTIYFDLWQTPTDVTKKAIRGSDPKAVYVAWVKSRSPDMHVPHYAEDDVFGEGVPIGYSTYNAGAAHLRELEGWLVMCAEEGYEIEFFEM